MGFRSLAVFLILAPFLAAFAAASGQTPQAEPEPRYDSGTVIDTMVVVTDQREVPKGSPLNGLHLIVRLESAKTDSETMDVYLGPTDFIKDFDVTFAKGDRLQVIGSKMKYAGNALVLAREVRRDTTTLYLRDPKGTPLWKGRT